MTIPTFANSVGNPLDLNASFKREMKEVLAAGIAWHGFRKGLTSNLSRSWTGSHLNSIGWSDSPAVENRLRASALPLVTRSSDSFSAELPGNKGDYEEHQISGEGDSWHSRRGIRAADRSKPRPNNSQTESGTGHGEIDRRGCRQLSGKFPMHPGARAYSGSCSGQ